jgi:hypothetical protein
MCLLIGLRLTTGKTPKKGDVVHGGFVKLEKTPKKSGKGENLQKEKAAIFALEDCLQVLQIFLEIDLFLLRS